MEILVTIGYIALCVILFSLAIAIHEWGHFIVALKLGLKVERFSIGFGPAIWKKTVNGVEYRISWIPLGGYVAIPDVDPEGTKKLEGGGRGATALPETGEATSPSLQKEKIPAWKELAVAFAGPFMNLVLAVVLALFLACIPSARFGEGMPVLDQLGEIGPAARAGLQRGDRVLSVNGVPVSSWYEMLVEIQLADGKSVQMVVDRAGVTNSFDVTPVKSGGNWMIGASAAVAPEVGTVVAGSAAESIGVKPGDVLVSFAGRDIRMWSDFTKAADAAGAAGGDLVVRRAGSDMTFAAVKPKCIYAYQYVGPFERPAVIGPVMSGTAAERSGLQAGDRVERVGGRAVTSWESLKEAIQETKGAESEMIVDRGGEKMTLRVTPKKGLSGEYRLQNAFDPATTPATPVVSVNGTAVDSWLEMEREIHRLGAEGKALTLGVRKTAGGSVEEIKTAAKPKLLDQSFEYGLGAVSCAPWMSHRNPIAQLADDGQGIFHILKALVTPKTAAATGKALGGPVMIAQGIYVSIRHDFWSGLGFLRYLNVNLAILNLLPIPVLDGGLILFALIALVFRRRVPEKIVSKLSTGFMYLLLALMAFLIFRDGQRVVSKQIQDSNTPSYTITDHALENTDPVR